MNIYGSYFVSNALNPNKIDPIGASSYKFTNMQLSLLDSIYLKNFIWNNLSLPLVICNLVEIDTIKLEFIVKSLISTRSGQHKQINQVVEQNVSDKLDIFIVAINIGDVCVKRNEPITKESQYMYNQIKDSGQKQTEPNDSVSSDSGSFKVHVVLPIVLSFFFVTLLIVVAIFLRKLQITNFNKSPSCKEKASASSYSCEKHLGKVFTATSLSRSCSAKCIDCNNGSANSSSSTTSSSPSTICTTSQIDRNNKLYYVDPHTYEDPAMVIQEFAQEISPVDIKVGLLYI